MNHDHYAPTYTADILASVKVIALVGASQNAARPSFGVMKFLLAHGYDVIPVNPGLAGQMLLGQHVFASLADIPRPIDMIDVFRNSDAVEALVSEVLNLLPLPKVIWLQLGVRDDKAAQIAEAAGIKLVMNRCPAIELSPH
jgi:uncharacterized protein